MSRHRGKRGKAPRKKDRSAAGSTVGFALCVYNEEKNLPALLESIVGAFDFIAFVDSHSTDATIEVFEDWAARFKQPHVVAQFDYQGDMAAKRNHAFSLLGTDWECWADADDVIVGSEWLRPMAQKAPAAVAGFHADYDYLFEGDECVSSFPFARLWRRGHGGAVNHGHGDHPLSIREHDLHVIVGPVMKTPHGVCHWRHCVQGIEVYRREYGDDLGPVLWAEHYGARAA